MKKRQFDKSCRLLFGKRKKTEVEPTEQEKHEMLLFVVRHRGSIHPKLITSLLDMNWLHAMGYLYTNKEGFLCNGENYV